MPQNTGVHSAPAVVVIEAGPFTPRRRAVMIDAAPFDAASFGGAQFEGAPFDAAPSGGAPFGGAALRQRYVQCQEKQPCPGSTVSLHCSPCRGWWSACWPRCRRRGRPRRLPTWRRTTVRGRIVENMISGNLFEFVEPDSINFAVALI